MRVYGIRLYQSGDPTSVFFFERSVHDVNSRIADINFAKDARFEALGDYALETLQTIDVRGGYRVYDLRNVEDKTTYVRIIPIDIDL